MCFKNCGSVKVEWVEHIFPRKCMRYTIILCAIALILNVNLVEKCTVKPVVRGPSKIEKTKVLKTNSSLMKAESIAEYS